MKIPEGMTEQEVIDCITTIANKLGPTYRFGYHQNEDMYQQAFILGIEGLEEYNPDKGTLRGFLWTHIRNRLHNFKRKHYKRLDKPCNNCPLSAFVNQQCTAFDEMLECPHYKIWHDNNNAKKNILYPIEFGQVDCDSENNMFSQEDLAQKLDNLAVFDILEDRIPLHLRNVWIKIKNGIKLVRAERLKILPIIREILIEEGYIDAEEEG